jgi:hypothetical protein
MTSKRHPDDTQFIEDLEIHIRESVKRAQSSSSQSNLLSETAQVPEWRYIKVADFYTAKDACVILCVNADFFTDNEGGKVYGVKNRGRWTIPKHHLARYYRHLWADLWAS